MTNYFKEDPTPVTREEHEETQQQVTDIEGNLEQVTLQTQQNSDRLERLITLHTDLCVEYTRIKEEMNKIQTQLTSTNVALMKLEQFSNHLEKRIDHGQR